MTIIDAHNHVIGDHPDSLELLAKHDLQLLNICFAERDGAWRTQMREPYARLSQRCPERYAWCTSFDLPTFEDGYVERVLAGLERDFEAGAVACKVWKNIGMEVRSPDGALLMIDDPLFEPIFAFLTRVGKPLLMHIAEPVACWRPLSEASPHQLYYRSNPQWHMYGRSDVASHEALIAARDRVVAKHPALRVVAAHLGSLEHDVGAVAERLARHANLAVDMSARLGDLMSQDTAAVRDLFLRYPDRILFGIDVVMRTPHASLSAPERTRQLAVLDRTYRDYFDYLETDRVVRHKGVVGRGISLPDEVLEQVYRSNARAWYGL